MGLEYNLLCGCELTQVCRQAATIVGETIVMGAAMLVCRVQAQTCTHATASAATAYSGSGADIHAMAPAWYYLWMHQHTIHALILSSVVI